MGREKRKRERSTTPPVEWEAIIGTVDMVNAPTFSTSSSKASSTASRQIASADTGVASREPSERESKGSREASEKESKGRADDPYTGPSEKEAWRILVVHLAAMHGDPEIEKLLAEKHPELRRIAEDCGATGKAVRTIEQARDYAKPWFERSLKGRNRHGPNERAKLCTSLCDSLKARASGLLEQGGAAPSKLKEVLDRARAAEEGPLICSLMIRELEGSRYDGIWVSRAGPALYVIGDENEGSGLPEKDPDGANIDRVIRVAVQVSDGRLIIDGFYHKGESDLNPVRCQIGPFLTVYFEGLSLKEALAQWKGGARAKAGPRGIPITAAPSGIPITAAAAPGISISAAPGIGDIRQRQDDSLKALVASLPPGWELRESRSKKGVYFYANPAKGLSQMERPKA
jgi:hypothetical protein